MARIERRSLLATMPLAALAFLPGCGFRPVRARVGRESPVTAELAAIRINPVGADKDRRIGQILRNALIDRFTAGGGRRQKARYELDVRIAYSSSALVVQTTDIVTRYNLRLEAGFELKDVETGETLYSSSARSRGSYDVVRSEFATWVARQDTAKKTASDVADVITYQLSFYFLGRNAGEP